MAVLESSFPKQSSGAGNMRTQADIACEVAVLAQTPKVTLHLYNAIK